MSFPPLDLAFHWQLPRTTYATKMPKQKRGRTDSGIGKDEYNAVSEMPSRSPPQGGRSNFGGVMVNGSGNSNNNSKNSSGRRTVSVKHPLSLKGEYLKNLAGLNNTFVQYCRCVRHGERKHDGCVTSTRYKIH